MRYLSLFSGIESATLAWKPLGWQCVGVAEVEPFPCALLKHYYPDVPNLGDVTKITRRQIESLEQIDLVVFGFPCQSVSIAGRREGLKNNDGSATRSGLFFDAMRIADRTSARWVVVENVPGLFSSNAGRDFAAVVGAMAGVECHVPRGGWRSSGFLLGPSGLVEWKTMDAQFHGLAQRRARVFFVRDSRDWAGRPPLFFIKQSLCWDSAPRREAGTAVTALTSNGVGTCGADDNQAQGGHLVAFGGNNTSGSIDVATALNACGSASGRMDFESETFVAHTLRAEGFDASEDDTGRGMPLVPVAYQCQGNNVGPAGTLRAGNGGLTGGVPFTFDPAQIASNVNRNRVHLDGPCHTLSESAQAPTIAFSCKDHGADCLDDLAPTMRSMNHDASHANAGGQLTICYPILEPGSRTGTSTTDPRAGVGIGDAGDAMFTLQAGKQHGVAITEEPAYVAQIAGALTSGGGQPRGVQMSTENAADGHLIAFNLRGRENGSQPELTDVASLRASSGGSSRSYIAQSAVRRITPTEAERLQGVPDGYTAIPYRGKIAADGPRYRALGNAMAVPVMRYIGEQIEAAMQGVTHG